MAFAASHYVGTEKQVLSVTQALRALNPNFLVLHYHLAIWQSAPTVDFITNGTSWGNDYPDGDHPRDLVLAQRSEPSASRPSTTSSSS